MGTAFTAKNWIDRCLDVSCRRIRSHRCTLVPDTASLSEGQFDPFQSDIVDFAAFPKGSLP
jgi:hypothetical protein